MRAILHFDGDAFFASVEQVMDYRLRGKPVVTGGERGAATSLSYEAKAYGLFRGMPLAEMRIRCPQVIVVSSDYTSYGIFAQRMYAIVRKYAHVVEEYSIDECFADITGLDREYGKSYEQIALEIKEELELSLGLTYGVGLAPTKTLAKIASKAHKPAGFTSIAPEAREEFLSKVLIHDVWGLGGASGTHLQKQGIVTALDFARQTDDWLSMHRFGKAYRDVWLELRGESINTVESSRAQQGVSMLKGNPDTKSLMRTRTFAPPSSNREFIYSQLSKNIEEACEKLRKRRLKARGMSFYLKTQEFTYHAVSLELVTPLASPIEFLKIVQTRFDEVYAPGVLYRASGVTLRGLIAEGAVMSDLFGEMRITERSEHIMHAADAVNEKYGRHTISLASSVPALTHSMREFVRKKRGVRDRRERLSLSGDFKKLTLSIPFLGQVQC